MALGIVPVNMLFLKSTEVSFVYVLKELGMVPTKLLSATVKVFMFGMFVIVDGNVPGIGDGADQRIAAHVYSRQGRFRFEVCWYGSSKFVIVQAKSF
jgi:hypothetical protein